MSLPGISVVIPAFNEQKYLPVTLASVNAARQKFNRPTEIIVVDNASTDKTAEIAQANGARVIRHEIRNISSVRNVGIRAARYDLILSIDADCTIPVDGLQKSYDFMSQGDHIGAALGLKFISDDRTTRILAILTQFFVEMLAGIQGAVFIYSRNEALAIGGFDESRLVSEDSFFALAMRRLAHLEGKKFGLLKSVVITTVDRKDNSLSIVLPLTLKLLRAFIGRKLTREELDYWYKPKR